MIPIFEPYIHSSAKKNILNALDKNWISSQGEYIKLFENKLAKFHNRKYCIVTSNCTTALHLAVLALDLKKNDEIICPVLSFIAPANMILLSGIKIRFIDIDPKTLNLDLKLVKKNIKKNTKAILFVNQFGHTIDFQELNIIKKRYNLKVIEDNAESFGGRYKNKIAGSLGDISTLSFFANKIITTGEGGALLTNNKKYYKKCLIMRDHGMSRKKKYFHTMLGFNYRMTNLQAAIGVSQLKEWKKIFKKRKKQMSLYYKLLQNVNHIELRQFKEWCTPAHWLLTITVKKKNLRNLLIKYLKSHNIEARPMINLITQSLHFKKYDNKKLFNNAQIVSKNSLHLPSSTNLSRKNIYYISNRIKYFFNKNTR